MPAGSGRASALAILAALWCVHAPSHAETKRAFTVADSIQMTVLNDPDRSMLRSDEIELSPDGRWFVLVTRQGNLRTGLNDYTLWLYDAEEVRRGLDEPGLPSAIALASFSSSSNRHGISQPRWLQDSRTVAFLAEGPGEQSQLYTVDIHTREQRKLTSHPRPVLGFDLRSGASRFLYMADARPDVSERVARGYEVGTTPFTDVMKGGRQAPHAAYFIGEIGQSARPVRLDPHLHNGSSQGISLSPSGRHAIVPRLVPGSTAPWWNDYTPLRNPPFDKANDPQIWAFATENPSVFLQYMLVDMESGAAQPLFDAPTGFLFGGTGLAAHWLESERSVILANTFLPLEGVRDSKELSRRRASPTIVEYELASRKLTRIVDLLPTAMSAAAPPGRYVGSKLTSSGDLIVSWRTTGGQSSSAYRKIHGVWREVPIEAARTAATPKIVVTVVQSLNQPPELQAVEPATGRREIITDLNPQFRQLTLGEVEVLEWEAPKGQLWRGGLLKPIGYEAGKRYPLVIQTHGFDPDMFLIDGPIGSPSGYAARALANRGMMVLQAQDAPPPYGVPEEPKNQMRGIEAAIEKLDAEGLIDTSRMGIHGFSRTGFVVQEALLFSKFRFAAASASDANSRGILTYVLLYGNGYPAMMDTEWIIGAPLWGEENVRLWAERDPTFHLHRIDTPLRIEAYSGPSWFDTYSILRRHRKPVEYWAFPGGTHNLTKPFHRLTSQEGTVDWYDFWLNGHEDQDPGKAAQYERWRKLRELHQAARSAR